MDSEQDQAIYADTAPKGPTALVLPGWFAGVGWSMFPTLRSGDVVRIAKVREAYQVGHVVAFFLNERLTLHRIVNRDVDKGVWHVKGDTCVHFDPLIADKDTVGCILMARRGDRIITIPPDRAIANISFTLGSMASKYLGFLPRKGVRWLYLPCFFMAITFLKCFRFFVRRR